MVTVTDLSVAFGERFLFKEVNAKFTQGNCYGVIGANGAGKSTFLRVLSGDLEATTGEISIGSGERMAVLRQDQFQFDDYTVLHAVIVGYETLYKVMAEREEIYAKTDFSDEDGMRVAELETEFAELGGWEAEAEAGRLLSGLGISEDLQTRQMSELDGGQKVRVLLAQALFGNPDILLLDEPTNNLDLESVAWLESFLYDFKNTVIVVSHDRHFLNKVCTHIADMDFGKISIYVGNYDFWYHASELTRRQRRDDKKRREDKIAELREFIQRFSSNAARSRQATSRQKLVEKLNVDDLPTSSRKSPYVHFTPERKSGNKILEVRNIAIPLDQGDQTVDLSFAVDPGDKIAFVGPYHQAKSTLFDILSGNRESGAGSVEWGQTISVSYFPKDNSSYFDSDIPLIEWLRQYTDVEEESYVRGFLGRMLFTGDESFKSVSVLSGGERVRCMLSKIMLAGANALVFDEPTNHLDLEAITALNDALISFPETVLFVSHDHQFVHSIANRIIELTPAGVIDRRMRFDDYLESEDVRAVRDGLYHGHHVLEI